MSALSEAIERANKRLERMSPEERIKFYAIVLSEELQREERKA